ncbi:50S ribosomal protein L30e [Candidatus Bathyarchaeota archaeon]|nr:50S ribosomal protein L30e [Candidatus Bathyarchaeota archaeon]
MDVDKAIATAVRTGKVMFGSNSALQSARTGRAKMIIVASNCPERIRKDIEYYCKLSKVPLLVYKGSSVDLAAVCGKPFLVAALTIRDPGDSDILKLAENNAEEIQGGAS